jgi:hypothetical protein
MSGVATTRRRSLRLAKARPPRRPGARGLSRTLECVLPIRESLSYGVEQAQRRRRAEEHQ